MGITELESRLKTLEQKFATFANAGKSESPADINGWIDEIHGTFANDIAYRKAAKAGRAWRNSVAAAGTAARCKAPRA
jgi:hypothetical protein